MWRGNKRRGNKRVIKGEENSYRWAKDRLLCFPVLMLLRGDGVMFGGSRGGKREAEE